MPFHAPPFAHCTDSWRWSASGNASVRSSRTSDRPRPPPSPRTSRGGCPPAGWWSFCVGWRLEDDLELARGGKWEGGGGGAVGCTREGQSLANLAGRWMQPLDPCRPLFDKGFVKWLMGGVREGVVSQQLFFRAPGSPSQSNPAPSPPQGAGAGGGVIMPASEARKLTFRALSGFGGGMLEVQFFLPPGSCFPLYCRNTLGHFS